MTDQITIRGARLHNLKNITLSIPKNQLVVLTGLSGSGKSTLGFDILHKEGQRQYLESLGLVSYEMAKPPVDAITVIYAHPQTHEQCSRIVNELQVPVIHTSSNAASAQELAKSPGAAAIVSRMTADLYKLPILRGNVENNPGNTTRFVRISQKRMRDEGCTKCSILIDPEKDQPGLLYQLLGVFADRGINLTKIESRPSKRRMGEYLFFIDLEYSPACSHALATLREKSRFRELGCYAEVKVPE